jgi:hypothetical protein
MNERELELVLESATTAYRDRDAEGRLVPPPAWHDLPPEALDRLHRRQVLAREVERALDPLGRSATVKAVLERLGF